MKAPYLETIDNKLIYGFTTRTNNETEFNPETAKIPGIWQTLHQSTLINDAEIFGVYSNYESDMNGFYSVTAGCPNQHGQNNLTKIEIQSGNYLVFENQGAMPDAIIQAWQRVWEYFSNQKNYQRAYQTDFEKYLGPNHIAIYIGITNPLADHSLGK